MNKKKHRKIYFTYIKQGSLTKNIQLLNNLNANYNTSLSCLDLFKLLLFADVRFFFVFDERFELLKL